MVTPENKRKIFERESKCRRCGSSIALTVDHIVPLSKGGTDDISNLQVLCRECNYVKGNIFERGWRKIFPFVTVYKLQGLRNDIKGMIASNIGQLREPLRQEALQLIESRNPSGIKEKLFALEKAIGQFHANQEAAIERQNKFYAEVLLVEQKLDDMAEFLKLEHYEETTRGYRKRKTPCENPSA